MQPYYLVFCPAHKYCNYLNWVEDASSIFAQSLWRLLPPSPCPSMSRCVVPAPCRGQAFPAPVGWEDAPPSWRWWQVTSWWTSRAATSLSISSSHQTDCACTGTIGLLQELSQWQLKTVSLRFCTNTLIILFALAYFGEYIFSFFHLQCCTVTSAQFSQQIFNLQISLHKTLKS